MWKKQMKTGKIKIYIPHIHFCILYFIHTHRVSHTKKKKKGLSFATMWIQWEIILLSEINESHYFPQPVLPETHTTKY